MVKQTALTVAAVLVATSSWVQIGAGQTQSRPAPVPPQGVLNEPIGASGEAVFPAFEGWGPLKDGTSKVFLLGYFNRNKDEEPDIPIGPNNRIEPGGPDYGQPTHFHLGRQYGVFAIPVPKNMGASNTRLTWTLVANGHTSTASFWMNPPYWIDFYKNWANGNEPPVIKFSPTGPELQGPPPARFDQTLEGVVGKPVALSLWAADQPPTVTSEAPPQAAPPARGREPGAAAQPRPTAERRDPVAVIGSTVVGGGSSAARGGSNNAGPRGDIRVIWKKYRGPGAVQIGDEAIALVNKGNAKLFLEAKTTASFSMPGEYWLRAQVNDSSGDGGGGDQCCWTTAHVRVMVR
jgi:hypothetical protein